MGTGVQRLLAALSLVAVLAGVGVIGGLYGSRVRAAEPAAARFFADDPAWLIATDGASEDPIWVGSRVGVRGLETAWALPPALATAALAEASAQPDPTVWTALTTRVFPDGNHASVPEVYVASADGITQPVGGIGLPLPVAFDPPQRVLPRDPETGATWSEEVVARLDTLDLMTLTIDNEILPRDGDCLVVRADVRAEPTIEGLALGLTGTDQEATSTLCPGEWTRSASGEDFALRRVDAAEAHRARAEFAEPLDSRLPGSEAAGVSVLLERATAFPGSADPLVLPDAGLMLDADEQSRTVRAVAADAPIPFAVWSLPGDGAVVAAPVAAGDRVVIADTAGVVTALDARSGLILWRHEVDRLVMDLAASADGTSVAVLDRSGRAVLFDAASGAVRQESRVTDRPVGVAVAADGSLVVADRSGVHGVAAGSTATFSAGLPVSAGPVAVGDRIVVGTDDGQVASVAGDGSVERRFVDDSPVDAVAAGGDVIALLIGRDLALFGPDLAPVAHVDVAAEAVTVTGIGEEVRVTTTAQGGAVRVFDALGAPLRELTLPIRSAASVADATQRAAAVTIGDVTWASGVAGPTRLTAEEQE